MTVPVLKRIAEFAEAGATISAMRRKDRRAWRMIARNSPHSYTGSVGRMTPIWPGRVIAGHDLEPALASLGIAPDFSYSAAEPIATYASCIAS